MDNELQMFAVLLGFRASKVDGFDSLIYGPEDEDECYIVSWISRSKKFNILKPMHLSTTDAEDYGLVLENVDKEDVMEYLTNEFNPDES